VLQPALVRDVFTHIADFFGTSRGLVVEKVVRVAVIWVAAWLAYQVVKRVARRIIVAVDDGDDSTMTAAEKRGHTVAQLVRSVGRVVVLVIAGLLTIGQFLPIGPLLAAGGILGLAVSFGSQSLVKDIIAGFFILVENQFAVGDVIEAAGKSGTVERMTLRVAVLRDIRGVLHVIPNGQITTVSNLTRSWSRAVVEVGVGYGTDVDRAIAVFKDELAQFQSDQAWKSRFAGDSDVQGVEELGEHGVVIRTLLRTVPGAQWEVAREFRRRIKNRLDAEKIEIPFPQRTVHVRHHASEAEVPADQL
jgi:small-conductance mechanosensitive channel